eukprot:TRINITY_DN1247_c0_g1_i4.p1 TRINITY_DN1247_c0_g1~~TRINITY_DN1247_c0_g1_i4.p1  ORF type:complete len:475 (+),score=64.65 TRINITY_DN1247_c0_g1_i4:96-1520(+)
MTRLWSTLLLISLSLYPVVLTQDPPEKFEVKTFETPQQVYTGFITIDKKSGSPSRLFYQVHSRLRGTTIADAPLILCLAGGPGESSLTQNFLGLGPLRLHFNSQSEKIEFKNNPFTINTFTHLLFLDQPIGTGYSVPPQPFFPVAKAETAAQDIFIFLQRFFAEGMFPELQDTDFYIYAEGASTKIATLLSKLLLTGSNNNKDDFKVQFKGLILGNPLIEPFTQWRAIDRIAFAAGFAADADKEVLRDFEFRILQGIRGGVEERAKILEDKRLLDEYIRLISGSAIVEESWREFGSQFNEDAGWLSKWLNSPETKFNLGVPDAYNWTMQDEKVRVTIAADLLDSAKDMLDEICQQIDVLIFTGQDNFQESVLGTLETINSMMHAGPKLRATKKRQFVLEGTPAGWLKGEENFHYAVVYATGSRSAYDNLRTVGALIGRFLTGKLDKDSNQFYSLASFMFVYSSSVFVCPWYLNL